MATKKKNSKPTVDNTYDPLREHYIAYFHSIGYPLNEAKKHVDALVSVDSLRAHDIRYLRSIGYSLNEAKKCLNIFGCVRNMAGVVFCFDPKSSRESD